MTKKELLATAALPTKARKSAGEWKHIGILLIVWAVPVAVLAGSIPLADFLQKSEVGVSQPTTLEVGSRQNDLRTAVNIVVKSASGVAVVSATSGFVTAVRIAPSNAVSQGTPLFDVNYAPVLAFSMASPLVRDLSVEDEGADVAVLGSYLAQLGYFDASSIDTYFSWELRSAVKAFQTNYGFDNDGTFRTSYVAYVPPSVTAAGVVDVKVGDTVSTGTKLFEAPDNTIDLALKALDANSSLSGLADMPLTLTAGANSYDLPALKPDTAQTLELSTWLQSAVAAGDATAETTEAVTTYAGLVVSAASPATFGTVPGSAVLLGRSGSSCVVLIDGATQVIKKLGVATALGGELGTVGIDRELIGQTVLRDALTAPRDLQNKCK